MTTTEPSTDPVVKLAAAIETCLTGLAAAVGEFQMNYAREQRVRELLSTLGDVKPDPPVETGQPKWLTTDEAADYLSLHAQTLRQWRSRGKVGPKSYKVGGAVKYKRADLDTWLAKNQSEPTVASVKRVIPPPAEPKPEILTSFEVAEMLGVAEQCVRNWRHLGTKGPKFIKLDGRTVRYRRSDVEAWIAKNERRPVG